MAEMTVITRAVALDDASVRSGRVTCETCGNDATGRMVDAYAAVFGQPTEVNDQFGHYMEEIDRSAFARTVDQIQRSREGLRGVGVYYNHAKTLYDTPSEAFSLPVGHPAVIRADGHGLLTSTHYTSNGEKILQGIRDGDLSGHSFTGRIIRSDPQRTPKVSRGGDLPRVRRLELGLTEYGPTPMPYYAGAQLVAVRAFTGQHSLGPAGTEPTLQPSGLVAEDPHDDSALRSAEIRHAQALRRARIMLTGVHDHGQANEA